jgi:hypothetical protein
MNFKDSVDYVYNKTREKLAMSPFTSKMLKSTGIGTGVGAAAGGLAADEGHTLGGMLQGGLIGAGLGMGGGLAHEFLPGSQLGRRFQEFGEQAKHKAKEQVQKAELDWGNKSQEMSQQLKNQRAVERHKSDLGITGQQAHTYLREQVGHVRNRIAQLEDAYRDVAVRMASGQANQTDRAMAVQLEMALKQHTNELAGLMKKVPQPR